ncbi:MAG: sulfatase [Planctomycetota bacterium]|jgi:arylsulfatase A-like enzyme|nr:sulfatase [Planctomycetota bacterium]
MHKLIPITLLLSISSLLTAQEEQRNPAAGHPNILVFLIDDMGVMDTSLPFLTDAQGKPERHPLNDLFRTPNMERLAAHGIRFEQFYANSVCSPTRVTLMTGQTSARHRTTQWILSESNNAGKFGPKDWQWKGISRQHETLPAILREAGYRTMHAGKAHFGPNDSFGELPQNFGFDINIAGCSWGQPGSYYGADHFGHANKKRQRRAVPGLEKYHGQEIYLTEALTLEMNAAIGQAVTDNKPFFAYMSHYAVHGPFETDPRFAAHYEGKDLSKRAIAFATMIEGIDKSLGDMLDHLDKLGVAENTLVFFLGDNGTDAPLGSTHEIACAAPLRGKKGTHYEGGLRVPFIAAWAKPNSKAAAQKALPIRGGTLSRKVGRIYDLFPTILAITGLEHESKIDGIDLSPLLAGAKSQHLESFLMHFPHSHRSSYFTAYRQGDWKLIHHYHEPKGSRDELFNLAKDRSESNNLAGSEPEQLRRMTKAMAAALADAKAQYPTAKDGKPLTPWQ